jgi:hypothetical protein
MVDVRNRAAGATLTTFVRDPNTVQCNRACKVDTFDEVVLL